MSGPCRLSRLTGRQRLSWHPNLATRQVSVSAFVQFYEWRRVVAWSIERRNQHVALVTINTNKANAQNPTFFEDLHRAFDRLEAEFNDCAVVLTGTGRVFSAGLDFDHHFPLFARRSTSEVDAWFETYRATNLRIFTHPRPTVAAINGHAYAGGLITALV